MSKCLRPLAVATMLLLCAAPAFADETTRALPAPVFDSEGPQVPASETAILAGGCFWGMQGVFQHVKGVKRVTAGYSGGSGDTAHYEPVGTGRTGHAESVEIVFDPRSISYGQILRIYFSVMDPTTLNYQGPDEGTQYRSEIFYASPGQLRIAQSYVAQLNRARAFSLQIVTQLGALTRFYPAEGYHQNYLIDHPDQPYIAINDLPKIATLRRLYPQFYMDRPVTLSR